MRIIPQPDLHPAQCVVTGRQDQPAGPYVDLGLAQVDVRAGDPVFLSTLPLTDLLRLLETVPLHQHEDVNRRLTTANERIVELEQRERDLVAQKHQLQQQLQAETDRANNAETGLATSTQLVRELQADPATISKQALLDQVRAAAAGNGHH